MGTRVLVTGGAGVIGSRLTALLVTSGHEVRVLDKSSPAGTRSPVASGIEFIEADSRDTDAVLRAARGAQAIFHLAAGASFLMYELDPVFETSGTVVGFHNVLEAAKVHGVEKIVYASTSAVYEGNRLPYTEDMELMPPDLKAFAKKLNEEMAHFYASKYGVTAVGLRPFSIYSDSEYSKGPYANVISLFAWTVVGGEQPIVWGDGNQTRDFVFVDDAALAFQLALDKVDLTTEINVGSGVETSFNEVLGLISEVCGREVEPQYIPVPVSVYARRLCADTTRAEELLDFVPSVPVRQGIERVVASAVSRLEQSPDSELPRMQLESIRLAERAAVLRQSR